MSVYERPWFADHEEIVFATDPAAGLRAIIAVHDTSPFGMAGGGCRVWPYEREQDAIDDVLRLSHAMSYKLALANLPAGGAKMIVIREPERPKDEALLLAIGRAVHRLSGRFIVGSDVGTNDADMEIIGRETPYVSRKKAGGDSARATAYGVFLALRWGARQHLGRDGLEGLGVAIQGVGRVGSILGEYLREAGARLIISDVDAATAERVGAELGAEVVSVDAILDADVDVFAPCALGNVIDDAAIERLHARVICGGANNPLVDEALAAELARREILFVPDFVSNLGGVIGASPASAGTDLDAFLRPVERVVEVLDEANTLAKEAGVDLHAAATRLANTKLDARKAR